MQEPDPIPHQKPPLVSNYTIFMVLLLILILLAAAWWAFRSYQVPVTPTAVVLLPSPTPIPSLTLTPTLTPTPTRTPRPTWTVRPRLTDTPTETATPSLTPTATRLPTITPARPYKFNDRYQFVPWTGDEAQRAAQMALEYPDVVYPKPENKTQPAYHSAFAVAVYAFREALLRFPEDPRANDWQWRLAYSLAQVGDPQAIQLYAGFIQEALKKGDLRSEDLPEWFQMKEPRLTLQLENIPPEPGQLNQDLILIEETGIFLWLVETPADIQVKPITLSFGFATASGTAHLLGDLTGEGHTEIAIYQPLSDRPGVLVEPRVFQLSGAEPLELLLNTSLPYDLQTNFKVSFTFLDLGGFSLSARLFPACPVTLVRSYTWDGELFSPQKLLTKVEPPLAMLQDCEPGLRHAISAWNASESQVLLETLLPLWPPALDPDGLPYPADAKDELRFLLGISQALTGQHDQAVNTLSEVENSPVVSDSSWVTPASLFLKAYRSDADLYRACQQVESCDLRQALAQISRSNQETDLTQVQEALREMGVPIRAAGIFDFDQDGQSERWITVQPRPGQNLEFWILAASPDGVRALFVDLTNQDRPAPFYNESAKAMPPVFQIESRKGFQLKRTPQDEQPYVVPAAVVEEITTYTRDALNENQDALLSGVDPALVRDSLLDVLNSGRFNCLNHRICDRFYYTLGLAYELAGNYREAIDTYIKLWWENSQSPYTRIARLKISLATPTPGPTRSATATGMPGTVQAKTPTPTSGATENPYPPPETTNTPNPYP